MKPFLIPIAALVILSCVLISGCTSGTGTAPATTAAPVPVITSVPATTAGPVTPVPAVTHDEPVLQMPSAQEVNLALTKDRPTSELHLLYQGGPGEKVTQKIMMWVYAADGTYTEYLMSEGKKPIPGDEIVAPGTRNGDRCVAFVWSAGTRYKVLDETVYAAGEYR